MLTGLNIRDVVLIEALDLDFRAGLGVLTGETGAGKSILLDSLGLALGMRADSGLVRQGAAQAVVTASFELADPAPVATLLAENGIDFDPSEPLLIRRIVKADGGSRAFVNDSPASAALLRELGAFLVEIHGQHDDRGLLNPRGHRVLLDIFGKLDTDAVADAHRAFRAAEEELAAAREEQENAARDREWLEHAVAELTALAPEPGEEEQLAERRASMQRGEKIAGELQAIADLLDGSDGALTRLRQAARILERIADDHPALAESLAALDRALIEGGTTHEKVDEAAEALAFDPQALEADEARLFELRGLARKHRVQPDDLAELTETLTARLARIEGGEDTIQRLEAALAKAEAAYTQAAETLSAARTAAAARLDSAVATELAPLKLDAARFRTVVDPLPRDQWAASGRDRVEFEVSTNPGAPFAPLIKIASGGELSRFILALKVALAEEGGARTLIFDEIDRGVGGAVASAIGERLARLAADAQLLVVTHSPQVAARGRHHLLIAKSHDGLVTRTGVRALDNDARREEIARMLSGAQITDEARAQADRLLETA
ncbi:DNA repair protein RecN [Sphingomonas koreensis]|jgi:DNA repair protein RecN (Recombination protein N)|uniref:DNA repair protein RecN n=1 Tax=Sphingomonas koreensis TaxID=93064 RepID=A0A1L6J9V5_9SPHN|nr:DNA repair protein RecN [Sphingomonas koreensis]APR52659.1 DNA repair protein RecN [Sphingomonas koreensis]MDC7812508.1 DNA repair protein RecN [Sphingomonas koreensis]RSU18325.1 DNA repair protein RecN [Sphingomonas koreensis]RSU28517.1 DNA repair protein RecN [Sphingomonas koreensis]RSU31163.1 DNA repair protein RecN [Sphingomonas koreensis]